MYFTGIIIAAMTFLTIGLWHPIVIKTEYYFGTRPWVIYLLVGISCCVAALFISNVYLSSFLGVFRPVGHRRTVLSEKTCRERLVPHESQAKKEIIPFITLSVVERSPEISPCAALSRDDKCGAFYIFTLEISTRPLTMA